MPNETEPVAPLAGNTVDVSEAAEVPTGASQRWAWWGIAVVLALTFAAYIPTLRYQFVHDDRGQIVENPAVHSWHAVPSYFIGQVWAAVMPGELGNYYRPLFLLWLRMNDVVFGNHAWGWHLTTLLTHILATYLVYLLAWRMGTGRDVALVAALIFGLHPAHIEGVAWISGVTEPLLAILFIGSFLCYVQSRVDGARAARWYGASLALFVLALLEKETALVLPGILLVYEWIFGRGHEGQNRDHSPALLAQAPSPQGRESGFLRRCGEAFGRTWTYFLLVALYIPARIYALKGFSHPVTPLSTAQLIFTWPSLVAFWIRHLIWPTGLSTFYDLPAVVHPTARNFILPAIFDACVALGVYACVRRSRVASFFAVWLVLPLAPLLNLRVFVANDFAHDRYLYLPSVGLAALVAMLLKKVSWGPPRWQGMSTPLLGASLCLAAVMSYGTITESSYFKDNLTFYAYNLTKAPHNPYAESNYATLLAEEGNYGPALEKLLDVANRNPGYYIGTYNLALTYYKIGKLSEADHYFVQAIRIDPNKSDAYFYLGMTRFKAGQTPEAIAAERQAIALNPTGFVYHLALGMMLKTEGELPGALREFKEELANHPDEQAAAAQIREIEKPVASVK